MSRYLDIIKKRNHEQCENNKSWLRQQGLDFLNPKLVPDLKKDPEKVMLEMTDDELELFLTVMPELCTERFWLKRLDRKGWLSFKEIWEGSNCELYWMVAHNILYLIDNRLSREPAPGARLATIGYRTSLSLDFRDFPILTTPGRYFVLYQDDRSVIIDRIDSPKAFLKNCPTGIRVSLVEVDTDQSIRLQQLGEGIWWAPEYGIFYRNGYWTGPHQIRTIKDAFDVMGWAEWYCF